MAQVRITNEIREHVRTSFVNLYADRISNKLKELADLDIGMSCYTYYIPAEQRATIAALNSDTSGPWVDNTVVIDVDIHYIGIEGQPTAKRIRVAFRPPSPLPLKFKAYGYAFKLVEGMACFKEARALCLEIDEMVHERDKLLREIVGNVLTNCTTLRQVLELWPTALDFMPTAVRERHSKKQERKISNVEVSIDDDVKASLLKARLLKSTQS